MIAVIADDFTGAAEIGGIGLRYGLTAEILYEHVAPSKAQMLIIDANTRSLTKEQAVDRMAKLTAELKALDPALIYKKVDSAMRGFIVDEINTQLRVLGLKKALLIPANPALGRTITNGEYFLHSEPIHTTSFAADPEFGITESSVHHLLRVKPATVKVHHTEDGVAEQGITVGEIAGVEDLKKWASKIPDQTFLAGGSGFFAALMDTRFTKTSPQTNARLENPRLYVSGSAFEKSKKRVEQLARSKNLVSYMPAAIVEATNPPQRLFEAWAGEIVSLLNANGTAVIAIHESTTQAGETNPNDLRNKTATAVAGALGQTEIKELLIEGGSTAAAIIDKLGLKKFTPVNEFSTGVIRMKADNGLLMTLKPGSYDWPPYIWDFE